MALVEGFSHLVIQVTDLDRSEKFYEDVLGLDPVGRDLVSEEGSKRGWFDPTDRYRIREPQGLRLIHLNGPPFYFFVFQDNIKNMISQFFN